MLVRINLILLLLIIACAFGVITSQYQARKLYQQIETEQKKIQLLNTEYNQLQLELSAWSTHQRVEAIAKEKLQMTHLNSLNQPIIADDENKKK